jgi:hypothetical protein
LSFTRELLDGIGESVPLAETGGVPVVVRNGLSEPQAVYLCASAPLKASVTRGPPVLLLGVDDTGAEPPTLVAAQALATTTSTARSELVSDRSRMA